MDRTVDDLLRALATALPGPNVSIEEHREAAHECITLTIALVAAVARESSDTIKALEAKLLLAHRQHQWFAQERDRARADRAAALAALDAFVVRGVAEMVPYQKER